MSYTGDQHPTDADGFAPGTVIGGKYVVDRVLGKGGMGIVLAAQHQQLREPVALKFLYGEMAKKPQMLARFEREARAAVRIKSEHVARVLDVGRHEGAPFIVMELLAGTDLHKLSAARGPLPWSEAALYLAQACDAVAEAHLYGIVHRDLKPANLFLTHRADGSPLVKVLDFGISKVTGEADENLTATTDVLGSPLYMSPEQIESPKDVDARTDVWALGAILYKLLSGRAAFAAPTAASTLAKIVKDPPPPLRAQRPDVPPELEALVLRCLEKDAQARVPNAAELGRALQPFTGLAPADPTGAGASYSQPVGRIPGRSRRTAILAASISTVAGAGLALWVFAARGSSAGSPAATVIASPDGAPAPSAVQVSPAAKAVSAASLPATASAEPKEKPSAAPPASATAEPARPPRPGKVPSRAPSDAFSDRL